MDEETIKEQFEEYSLGLKRYLAMDGVTVKPLMPQMADPTQHTMNLIGLICATINTPMRNFMGTESGHLASTQDAGNQNRRTGERQQNYCQPWVVNPTVDRLTAVGVLPVPGQHKSSWTDLNTVNEKDRALISLQKTQALQAYTAGGVESIMALEEYLHLVMGFSVEEARSTVAAVQARAKRLTVDPVQANLDLKKEQLAIAAKKASAAKKPSRSPGGRPAGRVQRN